MTLNSTDPLSLSLTLNTTPETTNPIPPLLSHPAHPLRHLQSHAQPPLNHRLDPINDTKCAAPERAEQRQGRHGPQDEPEVNIVPDGGGAVRLAHRHGEDGVSDHPAEDHVRADV